MIKPPILPSAVITRELLCSQALEISDMARVERDFEAALVALDFIASLMNLHNSKQ